MPSGLNEIIDRLYGNPGAFVERFRRRLKEYGIRQSVIAQVSGYSPTEISRWLTGRRTPTFASMMKLDEAMEIARRDKLRQEQAAWRN